MTTNIIALNLSTNNINHEGTDLLFNALLKN